MIQSNRIEKMIADIEQLLIKYPSPQTPPYEESKVLTHELILELLNRLVAVEQAVHGE
jgi:hypothetical protein